MAADQRKRRLSSTTTLLGYSSQEQCRVKKRESRSSQHEFGLNYHVSLKWDDNEKSVVAKEEQIGLSSRHVAPFVPVSNAKLADVITVPKEVFELNDLAEVLSYEVWQSLLSERERSFLVQFLPQGVEPDEVVQALLGGENFQFGSPFLKWGSSLCSGDFHPDAVVQHEKSFKANKKAYYSELQQYHDIMIRKLKKINGRCISAEDPEAEIIKIMSRSKGHAEKNILADANGYQCINLEDSAMYESPSSNADEKSYYSDNQKLSAIRDAEIQKRIRNQQLLKDKHEKSAGSPNGPKNVPRHKKVEKLHKANITPNDGTKYMSYVKISKKQHELFKSMKQSGNSIQSKNLNSLLGNVDGFNVKPYEMFVEEEQKRIHEHWKNIINEDLPAALQKWRKGKLEKQHILNSLWRELEDKLGFLIKAAKPVNEEFDPSSSCNEVSSDNQEADREDFQEVSVDHQDDKLATQDTMGDGDKVSKTCSVGNESFKQNILLNVNEEFDPSSSGNQSLQVNVNEASKRNPLFNVSKEFDTSPSENQSLQVNVKEFSPSTIENQALQNPLPSVDWEYDPSSMDNKSSQNPPANINKEFESSYTERKSSVDHPASDDNQDFKPMDLNAESDQVDSGASDCSMPEQHVPQTSEVYIGASHSGSVSVANVLEIPSSSVKHVWSSIGKLPGSFSLHANPTTPNTHFATPTTQFATSTTQFATPTTQFATPTTQFASASGFNVRHPQVVQQQPGPLIDLESDLPEENTTKDLLNGQTNPMHASFFSPFPIPSRDRNELLQSLIKQENYNEPKRSPMEFHPTHVALEPNQFPGNFREQLQPAFVLDHRQRAQSELLMSQITPDHIYYDRNKYPVQTQEQFSAVNVRDWNNARMSTPMQSQISSAGLLNHNWFATDNRAHGGWSGSEGMVFPSTSIGSVNSTDQSLYSVLSQCTTMQARAPYNPLSATEQMIPSTSYGQDMAAGIPMASHPIPHTVSPFDYLSWSESTSTLKSPNLGWMSLGHQPSALRDPSGKPFLKSWNQ